MVRVAWTLPDETFTTTEIEHRFFENEAWQGWIAAGQASDSAITFDDGPLAEGWVRYRVRFKSDATTTTWIETETIEIMCLGTCGSDDGTTGDLVQPDADGIDDQKPDTDPLLDDDPSPVGDEDPDTDPGDDVRPETMSTPIRCHRSEWTTRRHDSG